MTDWDPQEEMNPIEYLQFKLQLWVKVDTVPEWVHDATKDYYDGYRDKYGHRPYDEEKVFTGDSLEYKVEFATVGQGAIDPQFYTRIK